MQFGFNVPTYGPFTSPEGIARLARGGEEAGFDYLAVSDHLVMPASIDANYPYSATGAFPPTSQVPRYEQMTTLTFAAAHTSRVGLLTSVMVVPHRPAVLAAKMLATIDVLSNGRLILGIGAGWMREEFEAVGTPPFAERGAVTDEYLRAFRELWTAERPEFDGKYVRFGNITLSPKPVQKSGPPIWVGGESGPAMRRAARLGDGWYPLNSNPAHPLDSLKRYAVAVERLRRLTREAGRDPASVTLVFRAAQHGTEAPRLAGDGERALFSGSDAEIVGDLRDLKSLGVSHIDFLAFGYGHATAEETVEAMARFRGDVLAKV